MHGLPTQHNAPACLPRASAKGAFPIIDLGIMTKTDMVIFPKLSLTMLLARRVDGQLVVEQLDEGSDRCFASPILVHRQLCLPLT